MAQAYDFALDKIGMEIMSYQVSVLTVRSTLTYSIASWTLTRNSSPSVRFGWITSISSKECKYTIYIFKTHFTVIKEVKAFEGLSVCISREAVGSYAENQRITAVRRVYQRGCVNPMINIEQLWRDYSKYEEVSTVRINGCVILVQDTRQEFRFVRRKSSSAFYC